MEIPENKGVTWASHVVTTMSVEKKKKSGKGLAVTVGATSASIQCGPRPHSHYFLL